MTDRHGNNEGFRLLDDLVCQAIPEPSLKAFVTEPGCSSHVGLTTGFSETRETSRQTKLSLPRLLNRAILYVPRLVYSLIRRMLAKTK
jgi:hypothetical protein